MKIKISKISKPNKDSDFWSEEWLLKLKSGAIAICFDEADAMLVAAALRAYKPKKEKSIKRKT